MDGQRRITPAAAGRRPLRVTTVGGKIAFVSGAVAAGTLLAILVTFGIDENAGNLVAAVFSVCAVVAGCRVFRGESEDAGQPRSWWRMTSKPSAGWILCALFALSAASSVLTIGQSPVVGVSVATDAAIALGYANSSVRLRRS
jgi:hypothetical protein